MLSTPTSCPSLMAASVSCFRSFSSVARCSSKNCLSFVNFSCSSHSWESVFEIRKHLHIRLDSLDKCTCPRNMLGTYSAGLKSLTSYKNNTDIWARSEVLGFRIVHRHTNFEWNRITAIKNEIGCYLTKGYSSNIKKTLGESKCLGLLYLPYLNSR